MNKFREMVLGLIVGDAVGVPYEFKDREQMDKRPCTDMIGHGTHNQPIGTWSDDSSMALCIIESIAEGYSDAKVASKFVDWMDTGYMTPHGVCFDIGSTTRQSLWKMRNQLALEDEKEIEKTLDRCAKHNDPRLSGNGALMRILPFLLHLRRGGLSYAKMFKEIQRHCHITHQSDRSTYACFTAIMFAYNIDVGEEKHQAWTSATNTVRKHMEYYGYVFEDNKIQDYWDKILKEDMAGLSREEIPSSGYVMDTLLASVWCILTSEGYKEAVLKAVNLGDDTDTTAAVVGGLAGMIWGNEIPDEWLSNIVKLEMIEEMIQNAKSKVETI